VLVARLVILFIVMHGSDTVRVCGKFVKFRSSLM
jgi:hypothetical protein